MNSDFHITEQNLNNRYNFNLFINNPFEPSDIKILFHKKNSEELPYFSIVMPIHNQENIIIKHIQSIIHCIINITYEFIFIIDACSDNSEKYLLDFFEKFHKNEVLSILIIKSDIPLFETRCDNIGFICSKGKYILEMQADMEMIEVGFNEKLVKPFLKHENIIAISGRCCHSFDNRYGIGKIGLKIMKKLHEIENLDINSYYLAETCNRGPILFDNQKCKELQYLDEVNYFLGECDHDLFARAYEQKQWICGYVPIEFNANLVNGSTRKKRDKKNEIFFHIRKNKTQNSKNGFLHKYKNQFQKRNYIKFPL